MAAVLVPVVLLVIALALSMLVWGASETELQRASDRAAVEAAASALLIEFPDAQVPALSESQFPSLADAVPFTPSVSPVLSPCQTVGDPIAAARGLLDPGGLLGALLSPLVGNVSDLEADIATLPAVVTTALSGLPQDCSGLGPVSAIPAGPPTTSNEACDVAAAHVAAETAPMSIRFFGGGSEPTQPTCDNGRVRVRFSTQSPLLGFGGTSASVGDQLALSVPQGLSTVQDALATLGVRLDSALPNALCPQVGVEIDQPVRGPVFGNATTPNGRSTARRVMKNAVVVPVFNGLHVSSATSTAVLASNGLASVALSGDGSTSVTLGAVNLNSTLLQPLQAQLLTALDVLDATINSTLQAANAGVTALSGTTGSVAATETGLPVTLPPVSGNVGQLDLLACLRQTIGQLYDPPTGDAPTVREVLADASAAGEPMQLIQVGVLPCDATLVPTFTAADALSCVRLATGSSIASALSQATGLYDVPFFDITTVMTRDIGQGNFEAVPVHASQARGAFRATLVRSPTDSRYAP